MENQSVAHSQSASRFAICTIKIGMKFTVPSEKESEKLYIKFFTPRIPILTSAIPLHLLDGFNCNDMAIRHGIHLQSNYK